MDQPEDEFPYASDSADEVLRDIRVIPAARRRR